MVKENGLLDGLWATIEKWVGNSLQSQYATSTLSPSERLRARAAQFNIIARQYRAASLFVPTIAATLFLYFDSPYPTYVGVAWIAAVTASYIVMFIFQENYLRSAEGLDDAESSIKTYGRLYWGINAIWVCLVPLFWTPENHDQIMFVYVILIAHLVTVTAIGFRITSIYLSNSVPPFVMILGSTFLTDETVFTVIALSTAAFYVFLFGVARSTQAQSIESFSILFRNEELIEDLANAIDASDATRAAAEQANFNLSEREELFRALVEHAYDTILLTDDDGHVRYAAPSIKQFGLLPEAVLGRQINDLLPSTSDGENLYEVLSEKAVLGNVREFQIQIAMPDGRKAWIDASITDLRGSSSVGGLVLNIRDVTERKQADDEMHHHLEVLDALATGSTLDGILAKIALSVDSTNVGAHTAILLIDEDRCVVKTSGPNVPDELLASLDGQVLAPTGGCCGAAIDAGIRVIVSDIDTDPLGKKYDCSLSRTGFESCWSQPIFSGGGRILGTLTTFYKEHRVPNEGEIAFVSGAAHLAGIAIDRRQQENRLRDASQNAEMANRAKSRFLATMSHELRTPLNAIIGFSEVMQQEMFGALGNDKYREYSTDILTSGRHLLSMIDDILDLSKIEAGRYDFEERDIDFNEIIEWSSELIRPKFMEGGLTFSKDIAPDLPFIHADRRALRQVMLNLLSNAVKFTEPGGKIAISSQTDDQKGLTICVTDTGIGIPAEQVKEALEPFVQVESAMTGKHHGTGLGLSITKHLVEMHNGTLDLTSEEGVGTSVTVTFPPSRLVPRSSDEGAEVA